VTTRQEVVLQRPPSFVIEPVTADITPILASLSLNYQLVLFWKVTKLSTNAANQEWNQYPTDVRPQHRIRQFKVTKNHCNNYYEL
jgi:hypothetical protein